MGSCRKERELRGRLWFKIHSVEWEPKVCVCLTEPPLPRPSGGGSVRQTGCLMVSPSSFLGHRQIVSALDHHRRHETVTRMGRDPLRPAERADDINCQVGLGYAANFGRVLGLDRGHVRPRGAQPVRLTRDLITLPAASYVRSVNHKRLQASSKTSFCEYGSILIFTVFTVATGAFVLFTDFILTSPTASSL